MRTRTRRPHPTVVKALLSFMGNATSDPLHPKSNAPLPPMLTLRLEDATPSLNTVLTMHLGMVGRLKANWLALMLKAQSDVHAIHYRAWRRKARIRIERVGKGTLDFDNLVGGAKYTILDRLKERGLIVDDSPDWIVCEYDQRRCFKNEQPHTIVEIHWENAT